MLAVDKNLCIGCGLCVSVCPTGAITIAYGKATINPELCISCYKCTEICSRGAIKEEVKVNRIAEVRKSLEEIRRRMGILKNRLKALEK